MTDQKLTAEQIASFEARAAAGERPAKEWTTAGWSCPVLFLYGSARIKVVGCRDKWRYFLSAPGFEYGLDDNEYSSEVAAQLAAEHLLAVATAPLHAAALASRDAEVAALRASIERRETDYITLLSEYDVLKARAEAEVSRLNREDAEHVAFYSRWVEQLQARIAALEAALGEAMEGSPQDIRQFGWVVAVHNDYKVDGESHTFWLFTKDGRAVKGEGKTDASALGAVRAVLGSARAAEKGAQGGEGT